MRRVLAPLLCAVALGATSPALAQEKANLPDGSFELSMGARHGVGRLGNDFGWAQYVAVGAGYHPSSLDRNWSVGVHWNVAWSWFSLFGSDDASLTGSLSMLEMDLGLRVRRLLNKDPVSFMALGLGGSLMRSNAPIAPENERVYMGPYLDVGVEMLLLGQMIRVGFRYGVLTGGPKVFSAGAGLVFGR